MRLEVKTMVGRNCKRLRQRAGLTQDALAERLHVTRQAVSAWETGKNQPDVETLAAMAEALGADVRELIYGPGAVGEGYARFQRRYVVCTVLCAAVMIVWLIMELPLKPYLKLQRSQTYEMLPSMVYLLTAAPLGYLAAGCLIPAFASLWADIRVRSVRVRRILLVVGVLALVYYVVWAAAYSGMLPQVLNEWRPWWLLVMKLEIVGNDLLCYGFMVVSGCTLFLSLNR